VWATVKTSITIREDALAGAEIDVEGNACLLKRTDREALITGNVVI